MTATTSKLGAAGGNADAEATACAAFEQNPAPRIYYLEELPEQLIAEATNGSLYIVLNERGGWHKRVLYSGDTTGLQQVPTTAAQFIVEYVGGYWGAIIIVGATG